MGVRIKILPGQELLAWCYRLLLSIPKKKPCASPTIRHMDWLPDRDGGAGEQQLQASAGGKNLTSSVPGRQWNPFRLRDTDEGLFEKRARATSDAAKLAVQLDIGGAAVFALGAIALESSQAQ